MAALNDSSSTLLYPIMEMTTPTLLLAPAGRSGDKEKVLAMVVLGLGSFLAGMLPAFLSERNRRRFPLATTLLLCFGAGILLATAMVHILPEVREQMATNFAEISLCGGFFIIYFIDEFIHYFFGEAVRHAHSHTAIAKTASATSATVTTLSTPAAAAAAGGGAQCAVQSTSRNYGALATTEAAPLLHTDAKTVLANAPHNCTTSVTITPAPDLHDHVQVKAGGSAEHVHVAPHTHEQGMWHGHSHGVPCDDDAIVDAANAVMCHTRHTEPCVTQSMTGTLGLFVALSLHSAIEGLAIGVQNSATKVLFLLGAVACHKFVMGFCLGLEFRSNPQTRMRAQLIGISVFALGAVCGIGVGMVIVDIPTGWVASALPVIQALAGGTLLYVTVCEVMPREKARWHQSPTRKCAGFLQFLAVGFGFAAMATINYYLGDEDAD